MQNVEISKRGKKSEGDNTDCVSESGHGTEMRNTNLQHTETTIKMQIAART
jgi:hypothetical protein